MIWRTAMDRDSRSWYWIIPAVFLAAALPAIAFGAGEPAPASEDRSEGESEKAEDGVETKKGFWNRFKDPEDGKLDIMAGDEQEAGIFPIAIPFNEPAVGLGLVLAVGYFHPQAASPTSTPERKGAPPTATFAAGAGTTNGSWFAAAGHHHVWKNDAIRYLAGIGGGEFNLTFYGFGDEDTSEDSGAEFNIEMIGLVQQAKFRIAGTPVFVGGKYVYASTNTIFDADVDAPLSGESELAGVSGLVEYDTRDTVFTPNEGFRVSLDLGWYDEVLGGDFDYGSAKTNFRYYWPIGDPWVLGFRVDFDATGQGAPFYALPFVWLRGVPVFRYLGNYVATVEVEPRYKIDERWSVLAFTGAGRASQELSDLREADQVYNFGAGFRYLLARKLGLGAGIDVARGPEDTVGYLTIGSAW
jgi:hypothetical protein